MSSEEVALPADPRGRCATRALATRAKVEEELGDLLFVMANVARHLDIDPEAALRAANQKFVRRFHHIEAQLAAAGKAPAESTLGRDGCALGRGEGQGTGVSPRLLRSRGFAAFVANEAVTRARAARRGRTRVLGSASGTRSAPGRG